MASLKPHGSQKPTRRNRSRKDLEQSNLLIGSRSSWTESEPDRRGLTVSLLLCLEESPAQRLYS